MTQNILAYKEFIGSVNFSDADECFFGKIEGINDLVTFEGNSVKELKKAFHQSVDDYLALCKEAGNEPYKSVKGSFNVRIEPKLHYSAIYTALKNGMSLNQFVSEAIKKNVDEKILNHS
jgi:predicted HicB family RNase H-like nuclease